MAAILLVMSLESCSKANASADVIEEENNLYASFLMTMPSKFFTTGTVWYRVTRVHPGAINSCVNIVSSKQL